MVPEGKFCEFWLLGFKFKVDIWILQVNLGPLSDDLGSLGVDIGPIKVNFYALGVEFKFLESIWAP